MVVALNDSLGSLFAVVVVVYRLHHVDTSLEVLMLLESSRDRRISDFFLLLKLGSFSFRQMLLIVSLFKVNL